MSGKRLYAAITALLIAMLACNAPTGSLQQPSGPDAAFTAAAQTVAAHLTGEAQTQAASISLVTATPAPTNTSALISTLTPTPAPATLAPATATSICNQMTFVADVTIPDGTSEDPGTTFVKTWRVKNTGVCAWTPSYALVFSSGDSMNGPASMALSGNVNPGETVDISVTLKAPAAVGDAVGTWRLRDASGILFGLVTVNIHVNGSGPFAVTHVDFSTSTGGCGGFHAVAIITTNGPGTVTYHWVWSDGASDGISHPALNYTAAGEKTVSTDWSASAAGSKWIDIYIDTPNHQQFGRATFSCP